MENILKKVFGIKAEIIKTDAPAGLPLYLINERSFYYVTIFGVRFLLIEILNQEKFGAVALEKQLVKYMNTSGLNAAYSVPSLSKVQRDALVGRLIPFVSGPDQVFLPFLGIAFAEQFKKQKMVKVSRFTPAAQCLYLYFLYNQQIDSLLKKDAADALNLTRTSITRASEQLAAMGLLREKNEGVQIHMMPVAKGKEFFELGKQYLIDPVIKVLTIEENKTISEFPLAGESALAKCSMLGGPAISVVAVGKGSPVLETVKEIDVRWELEKPAVRVEVWKYDPFLFAKEGRVDPASMSISLASVEDERVQGELDEYLEEMRW